MKVKIKERSAFARLAALNLRSKTMAAVLGDTIHLWNVSREEFLQRPAWVIHELVHVRQFRQYGFIRFAVLYLVEYCRKGYNNNRFEVEARIAEDAGVDPGPVEFV